MPLIGLAAFGCWGLSKAFSATGVSRLSRTRAEVAPAIGSRFIQHHREPRTRAAARGGAEAQAEAEADSIEVGGFAGLIVGLALLPHVAYSLTVAWGVVVNGASFALGPYGLELISCLTCLGVTVWSLGSFIERGRGLPAGPLGLMGLSEGLSYLATLGLAVAALLTGSRTGSLKIPQVSMPAAPTISAPASLKAPEIKVPDFKAPEFKAPDIKVPEVKAPSFKVPDIKVPEIKAPAIKVPEVKVPEVKVPEVKLPEVKAPAKKEPEKKEAPKAEPVKKETPKAEPPKKEPEKKAPAPAAPAAPAKSAESLPDYDSLFD